MFPDVSVNVPACNSTAIEFAVLEKPDIVTGICTPYCTDVVVPFIVLFSFNAVTVPTFTVNPLVVAAPFTYIFILLLISLAAYVPAVIVVLAKYVSVPFNVTPAVFATGSATTFAFASHTGLTVSIGFTVDVNVFATFFFPFASVILFAGIVTLNVPL